MEFNQDQSHIITYRTDELKIFAIDPFLLSSSIRLEKIKIVRMFYRSNIFLFVGSDPIETTDSDSQLGSVQLSNNKYMNYQSNILHIYDDAKKDTTSIVKLNTEIDDVKCIKSFVTILSGGNIYVYKIDNFECIHKFEVINKNFCLSNNNILVYIDNNSTNNEVIKIKNLQDNAKNIIEISAHLNKLKFMTMNNDGTLLATASDRGTLIRIFDVEKGEKIYECRRGTNSSNIQYISFSHDSQFLAVLSDRGTIHIYNLKNVSANRKSVFYMLGGYFDSDWSFAWYYDELANINRKCCFDKNNNLLIIFENNICHKISFDKINGGLCKLVDRCQQ